MKRRVGAIVPVLGVVILLQGCVWITDPQNYRPTTGASEAYLKCYSQSQSPQATPSQASAQANMLEHCMAANGYNLRKPTTAEYILDIVASPVWFFVTLFSGFPPVKLGGGSGGE